MQKLNIEGLGNESKLYALGNNNFIIKTTHSPVCGWTLSIYDRDKNPLITGISLLSEARNLTWKYHARLENLFSGDLFILRNNSNTIDLNFYNFSESGDWCLYYLTQAEMIELGVNK